MVRIWAALTPGHPPQTYPTMGMDMLLKKRRDEKKFNQQSCIALTSDDVNYSGTP